MISYQDSLLTLLLGDCRAEMATLPDASVDCCVTSPPYWGLRDYNVAGQMGQEETPEAFIAGMVAVFREVRRVLKPDATCWINIGDSYAAGGMGPGSGKQLTVRGTQTGGHMDKPRKPPVGLKQKDLVGIPWMLAFALRADGWYLRQEIIWAKPNPMPESVRDRCTKAHESIFLLSKSPTYYFDAGAIKEEGAEPNRQRNDRVGGVNGHAVRHSEGSVMGASALRNKRSVWTVPSAPCKEAHFATYPPALIKPCILAGCPVGGVVLDPFGGSGTTGQVALELGRRAILIELNPDYMALIRRRTMVTPGFAFST